MGSRFLARSLATLIRSPVLENSWYAITPQILPRALNNVNKLASMSIWFNARYLGTRGIPNQPVDNMPVKTSVMDNHRARSLYSRLNEFAARYESRWRSFIQTFHTPISALISTLIRSL